MRKTEHIDPVNRTDIEHTFTYSLAPHSSSTNDFLRYLFFLFLSYHCHGNVDSSSSCPFLSTKYISMDSELNTNGVAIITLCYDNTNNQKFGPTATTKRKRRKKKKCSTYTLSTAPKYNLNNFFFAIYPLANPKTVC